MKSSTLVSPTTNSEKGKRSHGNECCDHYWVIGTAEGPVSLGICKLCGQKREFHNYLSGCLAESDKDKYEDWLANHGRGRSGRRGSLKVA